MPLGSAETNAHLARLRELCAGERVDLLEAALILSILQRDEAIDQLKKIMPEATWTAAGATASPGGPITSTISPLTSACAA